MQNETNDTLVFPDHDYPESNIVLVGNVMLIGADSDTQRVTDLAESLALIRAEVQQLTNDYATLHQELLIERELRTNAQIALEALAREIVQCDAGCTSDDWGRLVAVARGIGGQNGVNAAW